ncbi:MAG: hypothetical protein QOG20_6373 [Pseudonocardiales bacterium]|nr:hypothetical protein [Pseudonocardiales bacterium]
MATTSARPGIRRRASDALLRIGTENALDRAQLTRGLAAVPSSTPGHLTATGAMAFAGWVDDVILWASWRLRPRRISEL